MDNPTVTKLEILYNESLKDVRELTDRLERLCTLIPGTSLDFSNNVTLQTRGIYDAIDRFDNTMRDLVAHAVMDFDDAIRTSTPKAVSCIVKAASLNATPSLEQSIKNSVDRQIQSLDEPIKRITESANGVCKKVEHLQKNILWESGNRIAIFLASVFFVTALGVYAGHCLEIRFPVYSQQDRLLINEGRLFESAWPRLSQDERDHLNQLFKGQVPRK